MKKLIITSILIVFIAAAVNAQTQFGAVSWNINFPTNKDYVTKTSFAGGRVEYRYFPKYKNISFGLSLDWSTYEEYLPRQTFQKPDGSAAVTSDFVTQVYQVPIDATAHYYFETKSKKVKPYVGIALGAQYLDQSLYYNVYVSEVNNWGFHARPEIGALIYPDGRHNWGLLVGAYYSYGSNKTELIDANSFTNFGVNIGFLFGQ